MKLLGILLLSFATVNANAVQYQHPVALEAKAQRAQLQDIMKANPVTLPSDETPVFAVTGKLNDDSSDDLVLITGKAASQDIEKSYIFRVYFKDGKMKQAFESDSVVEISRNSPLGFAGVPRISNNMLELTYERSGKIALNTKTFRFRWAKTEFKLAEFAASTKICKDDTNKECDITASKDVDFASGMMKIGMDTCKVSSNYTVPPIEDVTVFEAPNCQAKVVKPASKKAKK